MLPRSEKSVWDKPGFGATLSDLRPGALAGGRLGSALAMIGARRGGFAGGLLATLGTVVTVRAAMGRHDFRPRRNWLDRTLQRTRLRAAQGRRRGRVGGIVPRQRLAVVDADRRRPDDR